MISSPSSEPLTFEQICGRKSSHNATTLIYPFTPSPKSRFKNLSGLKQGRLLFLELVGKDYHKAAMWKCLCDCGNLTVVRSGTQGVVSCGCYIKEVTSKRQKDQIKNAWLCPHTERRAHAWGKCSQCFQIELRSKQTPEYKAKYFNSLKDKMTPEELFELLQKQRISSRFKLTLEQYRQMLIDCNGTCICGNKFSPGKTTGPHIDHDHGCCPGITTCGKCVRGLLCPRCNKVLGMLKEDPRLLPQYLLDYLERYKWTRFGSITNHEV